jgi:DNA modification methylase
MWGWVNDYMSNYRLCTGDVLDVLPTLPAESYNAVLCDPPYGLSFMGKHWDHGVPSAEVWRQVWRVLKPGAVLMAFGGSRTWHRLAVNIEDAGFEMFDTIMWVYGSGFPKSQDISRAIDKEAGTQREVVNEWRTGFSGTLGGKSAYGGLSGEDVRVTTAPATDDARTWQGYGTALKPAFEPILCFRKPRTATYAQTAIQHGTGALNVDGCRIATNGATARPPLSTNKHDGYKRPWNDNDNARETCKARREEAHDKRDDLGRWPANVIFDQEAAVALDEQSGELTSGKPNGAKRNASGPFLAHANGVDLTGYGDTGGASRFFQVLPTFIYEAKAPQSERSAGLNGNTRQRDTSRNVDQPSMNGGEGNPYNRGAQEVRNFHPTVKPVSLTEYLARLIVPPKEYRQDARLLVPFSGSGSEMIGALIAGWLNVDGIELEPDYADIARQRLEHWQDEISATPRKLNGHTADYADAPLFAGVAA